MRILHTSDWHVGRSFHGHDLLADQSAVLGAIADLVSAESVDVVVVSGDIYDRALPAAEAVRVCSAALQRIREAGAHIVAISGNHDSAVRLGFGGEFLAAGGLHVRSDVADVADPVLISDEFGAVAFYGIPYLEPDTARHALDVPDARGHEGVLTAAMGRVRADLARRPGVRSVVLAHAFVVGGQASESERTITVGGVETAPAAVFDGVDYAALGHLHGAQQPDASRPWLRYSGSPLAYSFSEARQHKSVWLIDLDAHGVGDVRRVSLPVPRPLSTVQGLIDDLVSDPGYSEVEDHYVAAVLTDSARPVDPMRRLRERFPHAVTLQWQPAGGRELSASSPLAVTSDRDDIDVAVGFVHYVRNTPASTEERNLLDAAFRALRVAEAGG